jgi:hypothetical protein
LVPVQAPAGTLSGANWARFTQVPPLPVQAWQVLQDWLQHTPSVQAPDAQSVGNVQPWPLFFRHTPVALHELVPVQVSRSSAFTTVVQVPTVLTRLQALQLVLQAALQHTPSAQ